MSLPWALGWKRSLIDTFQRYLDVLYIAHIPYLIAYVDIVIKTETLDTTSTYLLMETMRDGDCFPKRFWGDVEAREHYMSRVWEEPAFYMRSKIERWPFPSSLA